MKNKYEIRGDITAIFCKYKGRTYQTIIDTDDLPKADSFPNTWFLLPSRDKRYLYVRGTYWLGNKKKKQILLHRLLTDAPDGMEVDHFNHDTLNNRRSTNLRVITSGQNNQNQYTYGRHRNKSSGIRGVSFDSSIQKWVAAVKKDGKTVYLGRFEGIDEAEKAAKEARAVHMPYSYEAATIIVSDPSKYFPDNERPTVKSKSGVRNVYYCPRIKRWKVNINIGGKKTVRSFKRKEDAIKKLNEYKKGSIPLEKVIEPRVTKSGIKGVTWNATFEKWQAVVRHKKRVFHLGSYDTKEEARSAVLGAEQKIFEGKEDEISLARDRPRRNNNSSGIRNVTWSKSANKWCVAFYFAGKRHHIGYYADINEASKIAENSRLRFAKTG